MDSEDNKELNFFLADIDAILGVVAHKFDKNKLWSEIYEKKFKQLKDFFSKKSSSSSLSSGLQHVGLLGEELTFKYDTLKKYKGKIEKVIAENSAGYHADWSGDKFKARVKKYWDKLRPIIKKVLSIINSVLKSIAALLLGIGVLVLQPGVVHCIPVDATVKMAWVADSISEFKDVLEALI